MSEIEAALWCCGAILWGLSGEGGPEVQALTAIALFIFFWSMVSSSGETTGSVYTNRSNTQNLPPSRIRDYNVLIGYMGFQGSMDEPPITSIEEGISRFEKIKRSDRGIASDAKNFFSSPYVIETLGLGSNADTDSVVEGNDTRTTVGGECVVAGCRRNVMFRSDVCYAHGDVPDHSKKEGDDWWEKGYEVEEEPPPKDDSDSESCGNPWCSNPVSAFDFRCFTCRRRFCSEHAGANIECSECSQ